MRSGVKAMIFLVLLLCFFCPMISQAKGQISIDASHKYKGMAAPFSKGYEPSIEKDTMTLVVPFLSDQKMDEDRITVGIDFEREENSPFYYKNYQKRVKKSKDGVYLYQCQIRLRKDRVNGQYPLHLWAQGKVKQNQKSNGNQVDFPQDQSVIHQKFTIYVEITDGKALVCGKDAVDDTDPILKDSEEGLEKFPQESGELSSPITEDNGIGQTQGTESELTSQPRLMISQNNLQGNKLAAGESIKWALSLLNCSSRNSVKNVKVTLNTDNGNLVFEKMAWYFEEVAPKNVMDLSQTLTIAKKAAAEPVQVQFQIEYEDSKGNAYTATETVSLSICQKQQAELASVSFPEKVYASDTQIMTFQVQNTGLSVIYNAKVRLEGQGLFAQGELFLGNLEGGASVPGEMQVFAGTLDMDAQGNIMENGGEKYGNTVGNVIFSYEDEQGEQIEQKIEFHTCIQEPKTLELKVEQQKPQTNQWWITIVAGVFQVLLLAIICLYLRMKHYQSIIEPYLRLRHTGAQEERK